MNKIQLIETVVTLNTIAEMVEDEFGNINLVGDLKNCADRLHVLALGVRIAEVETKNLIDKAKE